MCISSDDVEQIKSNGISKTGTTSPEASSTTSDSPTPTNSVHEKNWSSHWQSLGSYHLYNLFKFFEKIRLIH